MTGLAQQRLDLCDYEPPETRIRFGTLAFEYEHEEDPRTPGPDRSAGELRLSTGELVDRKDFGYNLSGRGTFALRNVQLSNVLVEVTAGLRRYIVEEQSWFAFGSSRFRLDSGKPQPGLSFQAGLGYGRFYDVTPLAKAKEIEEWLLRSGAAPASLSRETVLAVAKEIERKEEYPSSTEQLQAIVRLIEAAGTRTLDRWAVLNIERILSRSMDQRYCGWTARWGLDYTLLDLTGQASQLALLLTGDMALALPPSHQVVLRGSLSGPYYIWEHYDLELEAKLDYRLGQDITFLTEYDLTTYQRPGQAPLGQQSAKFDLRFHLGRVDVVLQLAFTKLAEMETWTQKIRLSVEANLW